jgi:hypothetical protein
MLQYASVSPRWWWWWWWWWCVCVCVCVCARARVRFITYLPLLLYSIVAVEVCLFAELLLSSDCCTVA